MSHIKDISSLEDKIGYIFTDKNLINQALTHSSFANEKKIKIFGNYERLEFLGDAVLELVSSEYLFREHQNLSEGKLTRLRSSMVCEPALAYCAREIGLEKYIRLGRGEEATGGRDRDSITSDVFEAVIGAIFLDSGLKEAKRFIEDFVMNDLEDKILFSDCKTALQELVQAGKHSDFEYVLVDEFGPDHNKTFSVEVVLDGKVVGKGEGKTKKAAEQKAAMEAIKTIRKN